MNSADAFPIPTFERIRALMLSSLVCFGRHTITSMLSAAGCQFHDWTADYRLFSKNRFNAEPLFEAVRREVAGQLKHTDPLVVAMDDTLLPKTGTRTPGVSFRRDPLGPKFRPNFVLAQRALQISAALPSKGSICSAQMIPIDFRHAPTPKKPKKDASREELQAYRAEQKAQRISQVGAERLATLRENMDSNPETQDRELWAVVDGSYANRTVLGQLPDRTVLIGRIRGDAKLAYQPQEEGKKPGRPRIHGKPAPTPQELHDDDSTPWRTTSVFTAGKVRKLRYKRLDSLRWRVAGERDLSLIVIAPIGYRGPGGKLHHRKPAFLICTAPHLPTKQILQAYAWRWGIEVNFRDQKSLLGVGEAQVRHERSVEAVPAMSVIAYSLLLLAAHRYSQRSTEHTKLPTPKWQRKEPDGQLSTSNLINLLRADLWAGELEHPSFWHFDDTERPETNTQKLEPQLRSAVLYA